MIQAEYTGLRTWIVSAWWPEQSLLAEKLADGDSLKFVSESFRRVRDIGFFATGIWVQLWRMQRQQIHFRT